MKAIVTGGCGFMGSHLVDKLMEMNYEVIVIDNLSSGNLKNIAHHMHNERLKFIKSDLKLVKDEWINSFKEANVVFHFAANPEVKISSARPDVHFQENLTVTFNVLEAMRKYDTPLIVFASSSTVYGDTEVLPTPESTLERPISVYGATKLAAEIFISTYTRLYGLKGLALRYANIIGPRSTHGVILDFISKLRKNPNELEILGDGTQKKSYLYIEDAINATLYLYEWIMRRKINFDVFNVGNDDWIGVIEIANIVVEELGLKDVKYIFKPATSDGRGWAGDVKLMLLDISKLKTIGWKPSLTSREAVRKTVQELLNKTS